MAVAAAAKTALELCQDLAAEPRIPGTGGYDRAVDLLEAYLLGRGVPVERVEVSVNRSIPTRSDVLLFEDSASQSAFTGLRERWSAEAVPTQPLPAAYGFNVENGDVRGPVVDAGGGSVEDFERLAAMGVQPDGAVALVDLNHSPLFRERILNVTTRAAQAGFLGVLVAPSENAVGIGWPTREDQLILEDRGFDRKDPLSIPAAPIRLVEAKAIRSRLRAKRVRGDDGKTVSIKVGPGPVEARVSVECPSVRLENVSALLVGASPKMKWILHVPSDESWELPLQGAGLTAAAAAGAIAAIERGGAIRRLLLAPRGAENTGASHAVAGALASMDGLSNPWLAGDGSELNVFGGRTRMPASYETSLRAWDRHFGGQLSKRTGAASTWIDYLLLSPVFRSAESGLGTQILFAPIPLPIPVPDALPRAPSPGGQ